MNVLLVGHGYWGKKLAATLLKFKGVKLFVYDKIENKVSLDEFLSTIPDFSHVFIATPEETHYELAIFFLLLNKNVFVEKPLCLERSQAEKLVEIAIKNKVNLFVDYIFLYDSFAKKIKEIIGSNLLGKIKEIKISRSSSFVNKPNLLVTDDLMIHDLYLLKYFFASKITNFSFVPLKSLDREELNLNLFLDNKLKIKVSYTWKNPKTFRQMSFVGEKKSLFWSKDEETEKISLVSQRKKEEIMVKNNVSPLFSSIDDFFHQNSQANQRYNDYIQDTETLSLVRAGFYEN